MAMITICVREAPCSDMTRDRLAIDFSWSSSVFPIKYLKRTQNYETTACFNRRSMHSFVFILRPEPLTASLHEGNGNGKGKGKGESPPSDLCGSAVYGVDILSVARSLACWKCGFKSRRRHGCLPLVSVVSCKVEVSAKGRSLVQRSPT